MSAHTGEWSMANGEWKASLHSPTPIRYSPSTRRHSPRAIRRVSTCTLLLLLTSIPAFACDACQKNQSAPLRGITHGTGPQSAWDMPIIWGAIAIVGITLVLAVKMLIRPGERQAGHIKHSILHDGL
ncbi:MAG: hypothetical protein QM724_01035 [Flavobacteriales bacterium]